MQIKDVKQLIKMYERYFSYLDHYNKVSLGGKFPPPPSDPFLIELRQSTQEGQYAIKELEKLGIDFGKE